MSILWHDVESRSAPHGVSQPFGRRFRGKFDYALRRMPCQGAWQEVPSAVTNAVSVRDQRRINALWAKLSFNPLPNRLQGSASRSHRGQKWAPGANRRTVMSNVLPGHIRKSFRLPRKERSGSRCFLILKAGTAAPAIPRSLSRSIIASAVTTAHRSGLRKRNLVKIVQSGTPKFLY